MKRIIAFFMSWFLSFSITMTIQRMISNCDAEKTIKPPPIEAQATTAREEIVTGVCTFGDCPVLRPTEVSVTNSTAVVKFPLTTVNSTEESTPSQVTANSQLLTEPDIEESTVLEVFLNSELLTEPEPTSQEPRNTSQEDSCIYSARYFKTMGVIWWNGWRWTWYSERVLPGTGLHIPGRYTDGDGYVRDGDGYICLASDALDYGTVIKTPFGSYGRVYDCGCDYDTLDVYVSW